MKCNKNSYRLDVEWDKNEIESDEMMEIGLIVG